MTTSFKSAMERLKGSIRDVPDFPKKGIIFKDITPILTDGQLFRLAVTIFSERYQRKSVEKIVAIDARGFIFGGALAHYLGIGLAVVRKKGKLPYNSHEMEYELEYGKGVLEMHVDAVEKHQRVVIIDDLLATGGTAEAAARLVEKCGGEIVELAFLVELNFLKGRERLAKYPVFSAISY
ncbi:MAG: adenine phosphoribosyltransferase [Methylacidiphilales bacterium]|nr:adenine phosphoribosyltransferase [Candidatus Methylacidiphilales bacterium]